LKGQALLDLLDQSISDGSIELVIDGQTVRVGADKDSPPRAVVRVTDRAVLDEVVAYGNLALGEAYMSQRLDIEGDDVAGFIGVLLKNRVDGELRERFGLAMAARMMWIRLRNKIRGRHGNIHLHFDIGNDLYEAFLDSSLAYTCGYVTDESDSLEEMQMNKYRRICAKLQLEEGDRLADLGCGFGGLLIYAAKHHGVSGKGLTISKQQVKKGNENIAKEGLSNRIRVEYGSYETLAGTYDKIVSVGMMEHLRNNEYPGCIRGVAERLTSEGRGLIHFIGRNGAVNHRDPFTQKYVFPGAHWPRLSIIVEQLELQRMAILDVENMARHYTVTLQRWLEKFRGNYHTLDPTKYNETFRRMWEYYLGCSIAVTQVSEMALYQVLFTPDFAADMPLRRL
jgi:cyclopropane-fatty-acyl-phospholipid synthase